MTRRPRVAFLFPGSGSQYLGMGKDFDAEVPEMRAALDALARELGYDLRRTMFEGPEEALFHPIASPTPSLFMEAISALSLAAAGVFASRGVVCDALAGRSMGEYTALMAAGCVDRPTGFGFLKAFADQAQKDWSALPGRVLTAFGLSAADAARISRAVTRELGPCEVVCRYRARRMIVVGGAPRAVDEFERRARAAGATRFARSREEGAIHTSLTAGLARRMRRELAAARLSPPSAPLWCNYDARPARTARALRHRLAAQLDHPVLWEETISGLARAGTRFFIELPPGRMLTDFLVPLPDGVEVLPADTPLRLRQALQRLRAAGLAR